MNPSAAKLRVERIKLSDISTPSFLNLRFTNEFGEDEDLEGLMTSVKRYGLLQPITVRLRKTPVTRACVPGRYEVICGHRRFQASKKLRLQSIPCIVANLTDQEALEIALVENIQRRTLDPIEEAEGFKLYITAFGRGSVTRLAEKLGKSEEYVSHRLLLLGLPKPIRERISRHLLKPSEATELVWLKDEAKQLELAGEITRNNMSFKQVRLAVKLIRKDRMLIGEAVKKTLQVTSEQLGIPNREPSNLHGLRDLSDMSREALSSLVVLNRAILALRTCLSTLDLLVEQAEPRNLHDVLMRRRFDVHSNLDQLIQEKLRYIRSTGASQKETRHEIRSENSTEMMVYPTS